MAAVSTLLAPRPGRPRLETRAWLRTVGRAGPERWVWPTAGAGWAVLVWAAIGWYPLGGDAMAGHHHVGTGHPESDPGVVAAFGVHLALWIAMIAATMLPLIAHNLRTVGLRSPRRRRVRATLEVAAGWALVWLGAGVVVAVGLVASAATLPTGVVIGAVCAASVAWLFARARRFALARCHRTFAPPLGAAARAANARFGMSLGRDCLLACGPSMVLMAASGHQLLVVAALGWLSWRDARRPHDSPGTALSAVVLVAVGAFALVTQA